MTTPEIIQRLSDLKPLVGKTDKVAIDEAIALLSAAQLLESSANALDMLKGLIDTNDRMIVKVSKDRLMATEPHMKSFHEGAATILHARGITYQKLLKGIKP